MKTALALLALCTVLSAASEREDITLKDGTILRSARVVVVGKDQVQIVHSGGLVSYEINQVPLDVLARARIAQENRMTDPERQTIEEIAANRAAETDRKVYQQSEKDRIAKARRALDAQCISCSFTVFQVMHGKGVLARFTQKKPSNNSGETFFIGMPTEGIVDGDIFAARLWRIGEYRYTSVQNAGRTVPEYTRDPIRYLDFITPQGLKDAGTTPAESAKKSARF